MVRGLVGRVWLSPVGRVRGRVPPVTGSTPPHARGREGRPSQLPRVVVFWCTHVAQGQHCMPSGETTSGRAVACEQPSGARMHRGIGQLWLASAHVSPGKPTVRGPVGRVRVSPVGWVGMVRGLVGRVRVPSVGWVRWVTSVGLSGHTAHRQPSGT